MHRPAGFGNALKGLPPSPPASDLTAVHTARLLFPAKVSAALKIDGFGRGGRREGTENANHNQQAKNRNSAFFISAGRIKSGACLSATKAAEATDNRPVKMDGKRSFVLLLSPGKP